MTSTEHFQLGLSFSGESWRNLIITVQVVTDWVQARKAYGKAVRGAVGGAALQDTVGVEGFTRLENRPPKTHC